MHRELAVVIPVYNEQESIVGVLRGWISELKSLGIDAVIHVYNDGSRDQSLAALMEPPIVSNSATPMKPVRSAIRSS